MLLSRSQFVCAVLVLALSSFVPLFGQGPFESLSFEPLASGLTQPASISHAGDGSGRLFIVEQAGRIRVHDGNALLGIPFLDISERVTCCGEQGMLDVVFHPGYGANGRFYVSYSDANGDTVIAQYQVSIDPNVADAESELEILKIEQPSTSHQAGQLKFGSDGYLYISVGDGGPARDPDGRGQGLSSLLGKILRIDVDGEAPYEIPEDNPFVDIPEARGEIWAYGLRNPWRMSFDRMTDDLFIGDVGQDHREEINLQPGESEGGENFGWRVMEGSLCLEPGTGIPVDPPAGPEACNDGSLVLPTLEHAHNEENCSGSIVGGYVYRGVQSLAFTGLYIYSDYCTGEIRAAKRGEGNAWSVVDTFASSMSITSFGEDENGELYLSDAGTGSVVKVSAQRPIPSLTLLSPFRQVAGGATFELSARGGGFTADSELHWNGVALPTNVFNNTRLRAVVEAETFAEEQAVEITIFTPTPGGGRSEPVEFLVEPEKGLTPTLNEGGVVHAATFAAEQGIAPGSMISIFGTDLAAWAEATRTNLLATSLGGGVLVFHGVDDAKLNGDVSVPFFYASPTQVNVLAPWELAGSSTVTLTMQVGSAISNAVTVPVTTYAPGIFTLTADGLGQAAAVISATGGVVAAPVGVLAGTPHDPFAGESL